MAEENNETSREEIEEIARSVPRPDEYPEGQAEELERRSEEAGGATVVDEAATQGLEATEKASDAAPVKAFGKAVSAVEHKIQEADGAPDTPGEALAHHHHDDITMFGGRAYNIPVYTSVFGALGVLTITEVLTAEIISSDTISVPVLLGIAMIKAGLVIWFYMHLNTDSRIFAVTLAVPVIVALLSAMFLFALPSTY